MEDKLGHTERWHPSSQNYQANHGTMQVKQKTAFLTKMYNEAHEYDFLQSLKGKYGGM